mgnify:FL=1
MKFRLPIFILFLLVITLPAFGQKGFDDLGYNDKARAFVGLADGVDGVLDGMVWGDPAYANDRLVMKWTRAWDECNANPLSCSPAAWTSNQWNGMVPEGSGETWHYKIVWVGPCGGYGTPLPDGSYCIWGSYAVIFSHGTAANEHFWDTHASPAGFGARK